MKALLLIFLIYINYVISGNTNKYGLKSLPKKVRPYGNGKILINSGKYVLKSKNTTVFPTRRSYTAFQIVGNSKSAVVQGVPDSPYFPVDPSLDAKPRVKKVLPDYGWPSRRSKRSPADEKEKEIKVTEKKEEPTAETTPQSKVDKEAKKEDQAEEEKKEKSKTETEEEHKTTKTEDPKKESITKTDKPPERTREGKPDAKSEKQDDKKAAKKNDPKEEVNTEMKTTKEKSDKTKAAMRSQDANRKEPNKDTNKTEKVNTARQNKKKSANARQQPRGGKKKKSKQKRKGVVRGKAKSKGKAKNRNSPQRSKKLSRAKNAKKKSTNGTRSMKAPKAERRLIAAREALIEDYPYMVSIQKNDQHWCSGALLNPRLVITTANCLWKANRISRMEVRAGSRHVSHGGQLVGIQEVTKHPLWGLRRNPDNDVALVLLDAPIRFSDSVHGIDLPNKVMLPPFDDAWVTSWGAERRDGVYDTNANSLQVYHTRLMDHAKCNNITMRFSVVVTENFICLAQSGMTAPCTRDTGAPAVSDGVLWGLASWGIRKLCGTERFPAMFSYLASRSNLDFITNATHLLMADQRQYPFVDRFPVVRGVASGE